MGKTTSGQNRGGGGGGATRQTNRDSGPPRSDSTPTNAISWQPWVLSGNEPAESLPHRKIVPGFQPGMQHASQAWGVAQAKLSQPCGLKTETTEDETARRAA